MADKAKDATTKRSHTTDPKLKAPPTAFKSGAEWTGNRAGRPKGSRNKLGEDFLAALQADFSAHGVTAIETVRSERPHEYLKVIAGILPKELNVNTSRVEEMSDDELANGIAALQSILATQATREGSETKARH
jgi:hypothetical protein